MPENAPQDNLCPQCSRPLPSSRPRGLCPACLLKRGLETNTVGFTDEGQAEAARRWTPPTVEQLAPLFPELDILELIGRGGMGAVYKAREKQLDRLVALKILPPEIGREDSLAKSFAQRFAREAQAMAKLSHPNIVTIYSFGQREMGTGTGETAPPEPVPVSLYFFIMEYVDGLSLRQLLDAGTISPKEALAIVPQICDALQYAHDRGIVHRDIKPENILLNRAGQVKIADFGLAKLVGLNAPAVDSSDGAGTATPASADVTQAGERVMGTPQYMAPEQIDRPGEVDHRADIYSLGVVFYQMLTGELPKGGSGEAFEPPSRKVLIDVRLDEVVLRALEREPSRRYQQVREVKTQVETIAATGDAGVSPVAPSHKTVLVGTRCGRRVVHWPGVALAFVFTAAAITTGGFLLDLLLYRLTGVSIMGWWQLLAIPLATAVVIGSCIWRGFRTPIGRLTSLDPQPVRESSPLPPETMERIELARQAVKAPAIGLIVAAGINLAVLFAAITTMFLFVRLHIGIVTPQELAVLLSLGLPFSILILGGAMWMLHLRYRGFAVVASILALIASPGNIVGLPFGIWALVVLSRREVIEAFEAVRAGQPKARRYSLVPALWAIVIHAVAFGAILAVLVFVVPKFEAIFSNMGIALPTLTRAIIAASHIAREWFFALFPMFLVLDAGVCLLLQYFAGPRARRWWSVILFLMTAVVIATLGLGLGLPYARMTQAMVRSPDTLHPAKPQVPFGPVVERVINDLDEVKGDEGLILATGQVVSLPPEFGRISNQQRSKWIEDRGIDLFVEYVSNRWGFMSCGPQLNILNAGFEDVSPASIGEALVADSQLEVLKRDGWTFYLLPKESKAPLTFALRTTAGGMGVLQIVGFTDNPKGARIRYKLLQAATSVPHILKTSAANFANDVDPSLDKITVTFDRPMTDKSWSFTFEGLDFGKSGVQSGPDAPATRNATRTSEQARRMLDSLDTARNRELGDFAIVAAVTRLDGNKELPEGGTIHVAAARKDVWIEYRYHVAGGDMTYDGATISAPPDWPRLNARGFLLQSVSVTPSNATVVVGQVGRQLHSTNPWLRRLQWTSFNAERLGMMRPGNFPLKLLFDSSGLRPTLGYYEVAETVEANPPSKRELGLALHLKMTNTDDGEIEQVEDFVWFDPTTGLPAEILMRLNRTQDPQGGRPLSHPGFVAGEIQLLTDEIKYVKDGQTWQVESWRTTTSGVLDRKSFSWLTRIHRLDVAAVPARLFEDALALSEKPGAELPERAGEISYDAARTTCTMPVKLQPGKVYWVGVNGPQHRNFKSPDGTPARPYQILFSTRGADGKPTPLPEELVKQAREINAAAQPAGLTLVLTRDDRAGGGAEGPHFRLTVRNDSDQVMKLNSGDIQFHCMDSAGRSYTTPLPTTRATTAEERIAPREVRLLRTTGCGGDGRYYSGFGPRDTGRFVIWATGPEGLESNRIRVEVEVLPATQPAATSADDSALALKTLREYVAGDAGWRKMGPAGRQIVERQLDEFSQAWLASGNAAGVEAQGLATAYRGSYYDNRRQRLEVSTDDHGRLIIAIEGHQAVPAIADANGIRFLTSDVVGIGSPGKYAPLLEQLMLTRGEDGQYRCAGKVLRREPAAAQSASAEPHPSLMQAASGPAQPTTSSAKGNGSVVVKELALSVLRAIKDDDLATLKSLSAGSRQGWLEVDWRTPCQQGKIKLAGEPPVGWSENDLKSVTAEIRREVLSRNPDAATKVLETLVQDDWAATLSPVTASQYLVMVFVKTDGGWRFATLDQSQGNLADDLAKHMANIPKNLKILRQLDHSSASQPATSTSSGSAAGSNRGAPTSQPSTFPATGPATQPAS